MIEIIRPFNCFLASLACLAGFNFVSGFSINALWAALAVFFVTAGGNAVNDFFDAKRDAVNKPHRPIPSGRVSHELVAWLSLACFLSGIGLSYLVSTSMLVLSLAASAGLVLYSGVVKEFKVFGNILVSSLVGLTFIAGSLAAGSWSHGLSLGMLAFVVNWSREIFKDLEETVPERWALSNIIGEAGASAIGAGLLLLGVIAGASMSLSLGLARQALFLLAVLVWTYGIINYRKPAHAQSLVKKGMGLITLALLMPG